MKYLGGMNGENRGRNGNEWKEQGMEIMEWNEGQGMEWKEWNGPWKDKNNFATEILAAILFEYESYSENIP